MDNRTIFYVLCHEDDGDRIREYWYEFDTIEEARSFKDSFTQTTGLGEWCSIVMGKEIE